MEKRLAFLLGSGVSQAAGMPTVTDITNVVKSGIRNDRPYNKATDGSYSNELNVLADDQIRHVLAFIIRIAHLYPHLIRSINYEDIAYVVWQVYAHESGDYENPAIVPLIERLRRCTGGERLIEIAWEAETYICSVVADMLRENPPQRGKMTCLVGRPGDI